MNRWDVLDYLKIAYMFRGVIPDSQELSAMFHGMDPVEFAEGIYEFDRLLGFVDER